MSNKIENDKLLFQGKKFSQIMQDIYNRSTERKEKIDAVIETVIEPILSKKETLRSHTSEMIRDFLDIGVKNDENLVKLAQLFQRVIANESKGSAIDESNYGLTSEEKKAIMKNNAEAADSLEKLLESVPKLKDENE